MSCPVTPHPAHPVGHSRGQKAGKTGQENSEPLPWVPAPRVRVPSSCSRGPGKLLFFPRREQGKAPLLSTNLESFKILV